MTPISYKGDKISHLSCLVIEIQIFGYLEVLGAFSYLLCKIWHHILARRPQFPMRAAKLHAYLT